ncbi:MAG: enoyl-CoA hydratase/isomerase family protein, partial [Desulfomonilaceae bacterium]
EALDMGLVDKVCEPDRLTDEALKAALDFVSRYGPAFESIKKLLRSDTAELMRIKDERYRDEMIDIWYSEETWKRLKEIKIH